METNEGMLFVFIPWGYDPVNLISRIKEFEGSILDGKITNFVRF
jgi:hypothetical protein